MNDEQDKTPSNLTDPVINDDISSYSPPPQQTTTTTTENPDIPTPPLQKEAPTDIPHIPATLPELPNKNSTLKITITGLAILAISAIALATFFFIKNTRLTAQLPSNTIEKTKQTDDKTTSTDTQSPIDIPQTTPPQLTTSPTNPLDSFTNLSNILKLAFQKDKNAQLLMITAENVLSPYELSFKYWFRQTDDLGSKKYFYLMTQANSTPKLLDKNIYIAQDSNTPSLNTDAQNNTLGSDLGAIDKLVREKVIKQANISSNPDTASAQFVKVKLDDQTEVNIWQLTYNYLDKTTPVVVQVNAQTNKIIFSNIKYNKTPLSQNTPTSSPSSISPQPSQQAPQ